MDCQEQPCSTVFQFMNDMVMRTKTNLQLDLNSRWHHTRKQKGTEAFL